MAGIANGGALPKLQLIRQTQDTRGRVIQAAVPERKSWLGLDPKAVEVVRQGMSDVVNGPGGTGHGAALSYTTLCGKTGTAQWGPPAKEQRLAWFAGFLPQNNPRYSFAVIYEGRPGETVSGGRMAAPMVRKFFQGIEEDIKDDIAPPKKALIVVPEGAPVPAGEVLPNDLDNAAPPAAIPAEGLLKALPVERLNASGDEISEEIKKDEPRAIRAIPVRDDEVIEEGVEEP
jgi:penicillin-binding protein 2